MFHVLKTPVCQFDYYGRYRKLWIDEDNFWYYYLEFVHKPKYQIWCELVFPCAQDHGIAVWFIWEVLDTADRYSPLSISTGLWLIEAYLQSLKSVALDAIVITTDVRTDIAQISQNFELIKCLQGT